MAQDVAGAQNAPTGDLDWVQWTEASGGNGHWYARVRQDATWPEAKAAAEQIVPGRTHLVTITSAAEDNFIQNQVYDGAYVLGDWIGGFQPPGSDEPNGGWSWVTGEPFVYTNWLAGEPNDILGGARGEEVLDLFPEGWNDGISHRVQKAFVVEYAVGDSLKGETLMGRGLVAHLLTPNGCANALEIDGNYAFVGEIGHNNSVIAYDISNPTLPKLIRSVFLSPNGQEIDDIDLFENSLFISNDANGIAKIDVSDLSSIREAEFFKSGRYANSFDADGGRYGVVTYCYTNTFQTFVHDLSTFPSPPIGSFQNESYGHAMQVDVVGDRAYLAAGSRANPGSDPYLQIVDLSEPSSPFAVSTLATPIDEFGGPNGVIAVEGDFAYWARTSDAPNDDLDGGLLVIDISDDEAPRIESFVAIPDATGGGSPGGGHSVGLDVVGHHVLMASASGLYAFDVSNPKQPRIIINPNTSKEFSFDEVFPDADGGRVEVSGNFAYVTAAACPSQGYGSSDGAGGLAVFEISDLVQASVAFFEGKYYRQGTPGLTWTEAKAEAEAQGGALVEINSAAENAFVVETFGDGNRPIWIGLSDAETEGRFQWTDGSSPDYQNWIEVSLPLATPQPGSQPDAKNPGEDYVAIAEPDGRWNDIGDEGGWFRVGPNDWRDFGTARNIAVYEFDAQPPEPNKAPEIVTPANVRVVENTTLAVDVDARDDSDAEGSGLVYAITGGDHADLFDVDPDNGELRFREAPDFEALRRSCGEGPLAVQVTVTDSGGLTDVREFRITVTDAPELDDTIHFFDGKYYMAGKRGQTWKKAQAEAEFLGGNLVAINSAAENTFIVETFGDGNRPIWIGLTDAEEEGRFEWSNGDPFIFENWLTNSPKSVPPGTIVPPTTSIPGTFENYTTIADVSGGWNNTHNQGGYFKATPGNWVFRQPLIAVYEFDGLPNLPRNAPPTAVNDHVTAVPGTSLFIDVLNNDFDANGDALTIVGASDGAFGETVVVGDSVGYLRDTSGPAVFPGDSFTYTITDLAGRTSTATVTLAPESQIVVTARVSQDGEQFGAGRVETIQTLGGDDDLEVGDGDATGLLFKDVEIAQGATITSAKLVLISERKQAGDAVIRIALSEDADGDGLEGRGALSGPDLDTFGFVTWNICLNWADGETIETPDLAGLVQQLVDADPQGDGTYDLLFRLSGDDNVRRFSPEEFGDDVAAQLVLTYEDGAAIF